MAKTHIITGLDIGTRTIKTLLCQKKSSELDLEVLGQSKEISSGVRKGVVINTEEVADIIKSSLDKVQEISNKKIKSVFTNVGGAHIFSTTSHGLISVSRADQKISQEDIERVLQAAQTFSLPSNKEILSVFPKEFTVDGEKRIKEPLGMKGVRLEVEVLVLGGFSPYLKNLTQAVLDAGFQIDDLILTPLASSRAVLTPREKELGVALLDIGAGTTGLAVFEEGGLIQTTILPIGSTHITSDIAIGLRCDIDTAEKVKLESGVCIFKGADKKKRVETVSGETLIFSQKMLSRIIEARVSEIFGEINRELKKISRRALLPGGVVLTGGGAKLPKIKDLAKKELRLPCRIGTPQGFSSPLEDPELSTVCGLVLLGTDLETERTFPAFGKKITSRLKKIFRIFLP
ncbi:cell division protein FtsA [Patescibacteria group bacterium]|nr:cell division protein FtsA [Patescibacteria group bacterium]